MRTKITLLIVVSILLTTHGLWAQADSTQTTKRKIHYTGNLMSGALFGKDGYGTYISVNTVHGVRYKRFTAGIGTGYDAYKDWNTLPVFGSISYDFLRIKNDAFFVQFNGGYAWAFYSPRSDSYYNDYDSKGGRMLNPMIGYRFHVSNKVRLYISAGYKFQRINYEFANNWYMYDMMPGANYLPPVTKVQRDMDRVVVQIGFGLF